MDRRPERGRRRPARRAQLRAVIGIALVTVWSLVVLSGVVLWIAPHGPGAGRRELLFGLARPQWGDVHAWLSLAALAVTVVHVAVDRRMLRSALRSLVSAPTGG